MAARIASLPQKQVERQLYLMPPLPSHHSMLDFLPLTSVALHFQQAPSPSWSLVSNPSATRARLRVKRSRRVRGTAELKVAQSVASLPWRVWSWAIGPQGWSQAACGWVSHTNWALFSVMIKLIAMPIAARQPKEQQISSSYALLSNDALQAPTPQVWPALVLLFRPSSVESYEYC